MTGPRDPDNARANYGTRQGGRSPVLTERQSQMALADRVGKRAAEIYQTVDGINIHQAVIRAREEYGVPADEWFASQLKGWST